jgi:hypothetical protein
MAVIDRWLTAGGISQGALFRGMFGGLGNHRPKFQLARVVGFGLAHGHEREVAPRLARVVVNGECHELTAAEARRVPDRGERLVPQSMQARKIDLDCAQSNPISSVLEPAATEPAEVAGEPLSAREPAPLA